MVNYTCACPFGALHTGPCIDIPTIIKEVYFLFFTSSILNHIEEQAINILLSVWKAYVFSTWEKTTVEELLAYIGCMVLMDIVCLPANRDY